MSKTVDLALGLLDHQLVDSDGRRCGKLDDLELEGLREGSPRVATLVSGRRRGRRVRVPWEQVERVEAAIHLKSTARELRLGRGEDRVRRLLDRLPGS